MLKVTSEDFHKAWGGMKAKANVLDLKAWMQATAARNGHIRAWQLFFEEYPVVLAPTTVKPTPGPREDTVSPERVREIFWGEIRFISAINVLGLPGAVVPVTLTDGKPIAVSSLPGGIARTSRSTRRPRSRSGPAARPSAVGTNGLRGGNEG